MSQPLRICNRCGWAHMPLTREYAETQAREFGAFITAAPPEIQSMYGFGPLKPWDFERHVARSMHCFRCGNPHADFHDQTEADRVPMGVTVQGIIKESCCPTRIVSRTKPRSG